MLCTLMAVLLTANAFATEADSWPQFRGPDGQGHALNVHPPVHWSATEHVTWKKPIPGAGWSSPVVKDGQIWLTTGTDNGKSLRAICLDLETGNTVHDVEVFQFDDPIPVNPKNSHASPSPILDGDKVYVHFGTNGTACLQAKTGNIVWANQDHKLDHKEGPGSSPVLSEDLLIFHCDGLDVQYVVALDKHTGKEVWRQDRQGIRADNPDFRKAYSTPLVLEHAGAQLLVSTGADRATAYELATGKPVWWVDYDGFSNVPRPILGQGLVYLCTGYMRPKLIAVRLGHTGDVTNSQVAWEFDRQVPANPSPVLVDDMLFMVSDSGILSCLDAATGSELGQKRLEGSFSASPTLADGKLYLSAENGISYVVSPTPELEVLAENPLGETIQASPAFVGGSIIIRTQLHLYRVD